MTNAVTELAYLYGKPKSCGDLRSCVDDFKVYEILPFEPGGEGEHLIIHIRKTGANTLFVARQLAKYFKVKDALVSYAGLKDRNAVTEQFFGIHLPGKTEYDLSDLNIEGVEVLSYKRHNKKLKTGALIGNRFELMLRNIDDIEDIKQRWNKILSSGVPNYFGEQRFGQQGNNLTAASELFNGKKVKDKKKRGFYLSAARSFLFNQFVSERIESEHFCSSMNGDVYMLSGSRSIFSQDEVDEAITKRLAEKDISITAPLWGSGDIATSNQALNFEQDLASNYNEFCQGLAKFGLKQERRSISLFLESGQLEVIDDAIKLSFFLPAGCYATTILRELLQYTDISQSHIEPNN
ncbi:tRNA pseudouridine(13) synthase TruD [Thalassotalea psychrophila]|uniref:tRNA pseudouridine synthase D n=1 Tax=Thalassotalea psychrophila TaxID=3065647 RepID=A0ABY9TRU2_9GAMM|nr:tRNA pseudouridine(13) synthase TruD [Colwelliaceae bacterium SQ149]